MWGKPAQEKAAVVESPAAEAFEVPAAPSAAAAAEAREPLQPENEYERQREARVQRNRLALAALVPQNALLAHAAAPPPKRRRRAPADEQEASAPKTLRRSTRGREGGGGGGEAGAEEAEEAEPEDEAPLEFAPCLFRYAEETAEGDAGEWQSAWSAAEQPSSSSSSLRSFRLADAAFHDPDLQRVYAASSDADMLVVGGHEGRASVFAARSPSAAPLLSWKAHKGWLCGLQLLPDPTRRLLLSASNDASVSLWDISRSAGSTPQRLSTSSALHSRGIFSLHAPCSSAIWTSSKDGCSRLSSLGDDGALRPGRLFEGHHERGVVKCVRARCEGGGWATLAADGGEDGRICMLDARVPEACVMTLERAHPGPVNSLEWQAEAGGGLLLSAGFDPVARLWDIRAAKEPLHCLRGHCAPGAPARLRNIYRPCFVGGGSAVASPGEGWTRLSLFCARSGEGVSQTELGFECGGAVAASAERGAPLLLLTRGGARAAMPVFREDAAALQ